MSAEGTQKERIEAIFLEVRELPSVEHDNFLGKACHGEPGIREAVENLVRADNEPDSLLDGTVDLLEIHDRSEDDYEGKVIGRYKILQRIGEGGFGVVYMADQTTPVRRKVALKLIKPGMDSKEVVARFEAERQALAMMDHPNIAKVLDAGTTDSGQPYFVMELVKGVPITEYCDHNALNTHERLELFNQVCRAVQHAHQKGVIHRDIKPTNVMVTLHDGKPIPKVIDFGVAKALSHHLTEKTLFTRYGQVVGTPQYMSPEQAEMSGLDVDTRSDIYSLGILLYELLTGDTPLDAGALRTAGYDAMRRLICELDLARPSTRLGTLDNQTATSVASLRSTVPRTLAKLVAGDLDWIVMKCLDKDRNRRYDSANGLVHDIERHLRDEPVEAGPPTFAYQLSKLYQRNRTAVAALSAIGAALLVGITLTSVAWANENEQRKIADEQRQIAEAALATSEENATEARQQAEIVKREAKRAQSTLDVIKSLLTQASPDPEVGTEVKVSDFLRSFASNLDSVKLEDPLVEIEIRLTLAAALARFSMSDEETQQYEVAEQIAREAYPAESKELARFLLKRAAPLQDLAAVKYLEEALGYLDSSSQSKALEVEIRTRLGRKLAWEKAISARSQMERACELSRKMSDAELATLNTNPYMALADHLEAFHGEMDSGQKVANEAIDFAKRFGKPRDRVESLLLIRRFAERSSRDAHLEEARDIATKAHDGAAISQVLRAFSREVWDNGLARPDLRAKADYMKDELVSHWPYIHGEQPPLGSAWGMLIQSGNSEGAAELETLRKTLSPVAQQTTCFGAGQWLRNAGMLRLASDMYDRADSNENDLWGQAFKGRCRSAARDFRRAVPLFEKAITLSAVNEITTPHWLRFELAIFLEASGEPARAKAVFEELVPDLLGESGQSPLFTSVRLICIAKSDRWADVRSETIQAIEAELKAVVAKDEERDLGRMLSAAALGLLEEHRGNREQQTEYFLIANWSRPGTFEQINGEWITETVVELLTEAGETERLEQVLRDDVSHRDGSLPKIHPERGFVRIRLAQMLVQEDRKLDEAKTLLAEAADVYAFHGDWIPAEEHEALARLLQTVVVSLGEEQ